MADVRLTPAGGTSERDAGQDMLAAVASRKRITMGADPGYDSRAFVQGCRDLEVTPHVAQRPRSAIAGHTTRHEGYRLSQRRRKRTEEIFGWIKTVGGGCKLR